MLHDEARNLLVQAFEINNQEIADIFSVSKFRKKFKPVMTLR